MLDKLFDNVRFRDDIPLVINRLGLKGVGIEIGTQYGRYAQILLGGTLLQRLWLLDCWDMVADGDIECNDSAQSKEQLTEMEQLVRERFNGNSRIEIIKGFSNKHAHKFEDEAFDFIYIDAAHDKTHVDEDLKNWYPKLKRGGLFSGHDYLNNEPWPPTYIKFGVIDAVTEFRVHLPDHEFYITPEVVPSWLMVKP